MSPKTEKLKNLEAELKDLNKWLILGLVPKENIKKHKEEIQALKKKIKEEGDKLKIARSHGEAEEYVPPKRNQTKASFAESIALSDNMEQHQGKEEEEEDVPLIEVENDSDASEEKQANESEGSFGRERWDGDILDPDDDEW